MQPTRLISSEPENDGCSDADGREENVGASVVASCDAAPVLEFCEQVDLVALTVKGRVVGVWDFAASAPLETPVLIVVSKITLAEIASANIFASMNSKQKKTLAAVFRDPVSGTIEWAAIENLLVAAGAKVIEGNGSRVKFEKDGIIASFHRPHPDKEAKRYQVRDAREFLTQIGVEP